MEFKDLVVSRRSIRKFLPESIAKKDIEEIISIATNACNSGNEQLWHFIIIQSQAIKNKMVEIGRDKAAQLVNEANKENPDLKATYTAQEFYLEAPVVIGVVSTSKYRTKPDLLMIKAGYSESVIDDLRCRGDIQTIGAVTQLILLAAWEKGLGSCWMTGPLFARKELEELLGITDGRSLAALIPIGKSAIIPVSRGRRTVAEVMSFI